MADVTKLASRRKGFGAPPSLDEASNNLTAPETAPAAPAAAEVAAVPPAARPDTLPTDPEDPAAAPVAIAREPQARSPAVVTAPTPRPQIQPLRVTPVPPAAPRIDGRSLRRTNRRVTFATRVTAEFDERVRAIAQRDGIMLVEVLERALEALDALEAQDKQE